MNYKLVNQPGHFFDVLETTTNQTVKTFMSLKDAKDFMRHLNLGGAFDGWTPHFFLKKVDISKILSDNVV